MTQFKKNEAGRIVGAEVVDRLSNEKFEIRCRAVLFSGGPFTDELRHLEDPEAPVKRAVRGASGIHIVLPSYYAPPGIGLVDMNTSDGRFLFVLPWEDHVLVGMVKPLSSLRFNIWKALPINLVNLPCVPRRAKRRFSGFSRRLANISTPSSLCEGKMF